jgi:hypothetical protein
MAFWDSWQELNDDDTDPETHYSPVSPCDEADLCFDAPHALTVAILGHLTDCNRTVIREVLESSSGYERRSIAELAETVAQRVTEMASAQATCPEGSEQSAATSSASAVLQESSTTAACANILRQVEDKADKAEVFRRMSDQGTLPDERVANVPSAAAPMSNAASASAAADSGTVELEAEKPSSSSGPGSDAAWGSGSAYFRRRRKRKQIAAGKKTSGSEVEMMSRTQQRKRRQLNEAMRRVIRAAYPDTPDDEMPEWCRVRQCLPDPRTGKGKKGKGKGSKK